MQIITLAVIKGGTAKSTTAAALSQAAVSDKKKVLCIDLDPQANLTYFLGAEQTGAYQILHGAAAAQVVQETQQGIDVIGASPDLSTEKTAPGSANRLKAALLPIREKYDYIFIDTPPAMGDLIYNALQASTGLLIPLEADSSSIQGLYQITDIAEQMRNSQLSVIGSVLTRYDGRAKINRYLKGILAEKGQEVNAPLLMEIRAGIAVREAQAMQQSLFDYAPNSNPARDYFELYWRLRRWQERKTLVK